MNKELFASMREQMSPSGEARAALSEKLTAPRKKRVPVGRYAALAACAAVIIAAVPVYGMVRDHLKWQLILDSFQPLGTVQSDCTARPEKPHSYVLSDGLACWPEDNTATENSLATGSNDEDQGMTSGELTDNMLEAGFTQEDVDAYLASGWQMTWAKWWKFYHLSEETGERTLEALLAFSQSEGLAVNTGEAPVEMPGGAYVGDALAQGEAVMAYQNLMDRFKMDCGPDRYPEWYGGAYIDNHAGLIVNIVEYYEPEDKELFFQIWDWAGSDKVGFGSCQLSLNQLRELQDKTVAAMQALGLPVGCGVNEETGQVELTLPEVNDAALWKLAELDPAGTAILAMVSQAPVADLTEGPAPVENPVSHAVQPGGRIEDLDEDNAIAYEPQG